mmetsp:Transcript_991/g.2173  ORF Transcript_991/g.2173 Transcript_991/m.2173 type:complete len:94 (+) Transcript_991:105-386(+)
MINFPVGLRLDSSPSFFPCPFYLQLLTFSAADFPATSQQLLKNFPTTSQPLSNNFSTFQEKFPTSGPAHHLTSSIDLANASSSAVSLHCASVF